MQKKISLSQKSNTIVKRTSALLMAMVFVLSMSVCCFADGTGNEAFDTAKDISNDLVTDLRDFALTGSILVGTICAFMWLFSKDQRKVDFAASWGLRIALGLLLVYLIEPIANTIVSYVSK